MKILRIPIVFLLLIGLVLVRKFEVNLFYDPLLDFFHQDFMNVQFPVMDLAQHLWSVFFRYILNSVLSLGIVYFIFKDVKIIKFSALVFLGFFFIFLIPYIYFIHIEFKGFYTAGFYVRRLLIQPVLLLILVPAIWYWKKTRHILED